MTAEENAIQFLVNQYLTYGERIRIASKHGINKRRAYRILQRKGVPRDSESGFMNECISIASRRKKEKEEQLKRLTQ